MSNIAEGIEYILQQAREERTQPKTAEIKTAAEVSSDPVPGLIGDGLRKVAQSNLAADDEDVTVGDLQALMREFQ